MALEGCEPRSEVWCFGFYEGRATKTDCKDALADCETETGAFVERLQCPAQSIRCVHEARPGRATASTEPRAQRYLSPLGAVDVRGHDETAAVLLEAYGAQRHGDEVFDAIVAAASGASSSSAVARDLIALVEATAVRRSTRRGGSAARAARLRRSPSAWGRS